MRASVNDAKAIKIIVSTAGPDVWPSATNGHTQLTEQGGLLPHRLHYRSAQFDIDILGDLNLLLDRYTQTHPLGPSLVHLSRWDNYRQPSLLTSLICFSSLISLFLTNSSRMRCRAAEMVRKSPVNTSFLVRCNILYQRRAYNRGKRACVRWVQTTGGGKLLPFLLTSRLRELIICVAGSGKTDRVQSMGQICFNFTQQRQNQCLRCRCQAIDGSNQLSFNENRWKQTIKWN